MSNKYVMPQDVIDEVLSPGYAPIEAGYKLLPDGGAIVAVRARFDNCTVEMVKWWMEDYVQGTYEYQLWHQGHGTFSWDENKRPGTVIGASHISAEKIGKHVVPMKISFYDPAEVLGVTDYADPDLKAVVTGSVFLPDGTLVTSFIQCMRVAYYGTEMRMRFYMKGANAPMCENSLRHNIEEMENLATFLPGLYKREQVRREPRN